MNQTIGDVTNGIGTVAGDNNINTVNNVIHNNVTINCTPAQKDEIVVHGHRSGRRRSSDPETSRTLPTLQSGALHQELCKATHFGDIDKNRTSWYPEKGTNMRVIQTAKRCRVQNSRDQQDHLQ
jgi:hypothetical protein